jgi:hypothetical protein
VDDVGGTSTGRIVDYISSAVTIFRDSGVCELIEFVADGVNGAGSGVAYHPIQPIVVFGFVLGLQPKVPGWAAKCHRELLVWSIVGPVSARTL